MTIKDLIELNAYIGDIAIDVREGGNRLVDYLAIGPQAGKEPPYPMMINQGRDGAHKGTYILKDINSKDKGREYYEIRVKDIPEAWLNLEVFSWSSRRTYRGISTMHSLEEIHITALPSGEKLVVKDNQKKEEQLPGQMYITDWLE